MALIQDIIAKHISDKKGSHVFVSRLAIAAIAREYHKAMQPEQPPLATKTQTEKAYSNGYKQGYLDRSNAEYDRAIFSRWKEHVAGPTEKATEFEMNTDENFELFEPEVIC